MSELSLHRSEQIRNMQLRLIMMRDEYEFFLEHCFFPDAEYTIRPRRPELTFAEVNETFDLLARLERIIETTEQRLMNYDSDV